MTTNTDTNPAVQIQIQKQLWGKKPPAPTGGTGPYLSNLACEETLKASCRALEVKGYRLAFLMGITPTNYLKWFNGSSRPSSKSFARLSMIHVFHTFGLKIPLVDRIDWVNDEIVYKRGVEIGDARGRDPIHKFCGGIPGPQS